MQNYCKWGWYAIPNLGYFPPVLIIFRRDGHIGNVMWQRFSCMSMWKNLESESSIATTWDNWYGASWLRGGNNCFCRLRNYKKWKFIKSGEDRFVYLRLFHLSYLSYLFYELFRAFSQVAFLPLNRGGKRPLKKTFRQPLIESYVISIWG